MYGISVYSHNLEIHRNRHNNYYVPNFATNYMLLIFYLTPFDVYAMHVLDLTAV